MIPECLARTLKTKYVCPRYWMSKVGIDTKTFNKYFFFLCGIELKKRFKKWIHR